MENIQNKMTDSGKRISFGEGKAFREPTKGKGRYDLVSPFAIDRLAKWMELGSLNMLTVTGKKVVYHFQDLPILH